MKKGKRKKRARSQAQQAFVRGFVASALLASLDRPGGALGRVDRNNMRRALRGGIAVASGSVVAEALQERKYSRSVVALAAGAASMAIIGRYSTPESDESRGKKEEVQQVQA